MMPIIIVFVALFLLRPGSWLWVVPALWPIIDLAPWTGWIHFTESDALVLSVMVGVGLRECLRPPTPAETGQAFRIGPVALLMFALVAISYAVSAWRVPIPLPPFDPALFAGYKTPLNGVRVLKGCVLAILLIPALQAVGRELGARAPARLATGLTLGLLAAALAATWERFEFPGLLDFSADYRTTGQFWDMHVGGAALDAWLALTLPFAVAGFVAAKDLKHRSLYLTMIGFAAYAILTTFSRGLYAGVVGAILVLLIAMRAQPARSAEPRDPGILRGGSWIAAAALLMLAPVSFAGGGYRGLVALLGFVLLIYLNGGATDLARKRVALTSIFLGAIVGALLSAMANVLPKGPYVLFGLLFIASMIHGIRTLRHPTTGGQTFALSATAATGIAAANVGLYWGEGEGAVGIVLAILAGLLILLMQTSIRPIWRASANGALNIVLMLGLAAALSVGIGSYYVGERFSTTSQDLDGRIQHWKDGARLVRSTEDALFGIGLGRYPEAYFWSGPLAADAGAWQLPAEDDNRFSRLIAPRHELSFGDVFRISQRVPTDTLGPFHYRMRVRAPSPTRLHLEVCRKHLLYTNRCAIASLEVDGGPWREISGTTEVGNLPPPEGMHRPSTVLSLAVAGHAPVDVDDVEIMDSSGRMIVANGDFEQGVSRWFFSSDRHHLPWHAKSLPLHIWIEQGWFGVLAIGSTLLAALSRVAFGRARLHPFAPPLLAGLIGFLVVGIFDSLLDMPRMTLMLLMLSWVALTLSPARSYRSA